MSPYRLGSLFSGIGGLELGFEMTGAFQTVFQVERDPWARRVLAKHWPEVPRYDDVRTVGRHDLPECDVLVGGFPCQDLSHAGQRAGLEGERSGLWWEFHRIVSELRPRCVVVENVPGLFIRGFGDVLGSLADLGYDASWEVVSAASQGAPHLRERVFIVAYTDGLRLDRQGTPASGTERHAARGEPAPRGQAVADAANDRARRGQQLAQGGEGARDVADAAGDRLGTARQRGRHDGNPDGRSRWATEPDVGRVAYGIPRRVDRLRGLGNAVVPQVARFVAERVLESGVLE